MARTLEQVLREYLGDQVLTMAKMTAELEMLRDEVKRTRDDPDAPTIHMRGTDHDDPVPDRPARPNGHG